MSVPKVEMSVLDGQLGVRPPVDAVLAIIGCADQGGDVPALYTRISDIEAEFGGGPLVQHAAYAIERYGLTVLPIRAAANNPGTYDGANITGWLGTAEPHASTLTEPNDEYELYVIFTTSGTLGVTGLVYQTSRDGGKTLSSKAMLGTGTSIVVPDTGGAVVVFEPPSAATISYINAVRTAYIGHISNTGGTWHATADAANVVTLDAATTIAEAILLVNHLRTLIIAHFAMASPQHTAADTTSDDNISAVATSAHTAVDLANSLKTAIDAHRAKSSTHANIDTTNTISGTASHGTIVAGAVVVVPTSAPRWNPDSLVAAMEQLRLTKRSWTILSILGALTSADVSTIDAKMEEMRATIGRNRRALSHWRKPNLGETRQQYQAAFDTEFANVACRRLAIVAGYARVDVSTKGRHKLRMSPIVAIAPLVCSVDAHVDIAQLDYGPLPGVSIDDGKGNPEEHDEFLFPGFDDMRATTLRTWEGRVGVWVNNLRLLSPTDSDYIYMQYGRIVDIACHIARTQLEPLLSVGFKVLDDNTGRIDPEDADTIDGQITSALISALVGPGKATSAIFALNRDDDVLRTGEISWVVRVVPLAYVKKFKGQVALVASDKAPAILQ